MKKNKLRLFKKLICLTAACAVSLQLFGITAFAAQETTSWSLYYNPSGPPAENLTSWSRAMIAYGATSYFTVSSIANGASVKITVPNAASGSGAVFSSRYTDHPIRVTRGLTYTYTVKFVNYPGTPGRASGSIKH